jgi:hypothetical protein
VIPMVKIGRLQKLLKMGVNKFGNVFAGFLFLVVVFSASAFAFSVGFESTELNLLPGESYESAFSVQNYGEPSSDVMIEAIIEEGAEYIAFSEGGSTIYVPAKSSVAAFVTISVPEDASVGDSFPLSILFRQISGGVPDNGGEGTTVNFQISRLRTINLNVVSERLEETPTPTEQTQSSSSGVIWWVIGIIILVIIIWFVIKSRKSNDGSMPSVNAKSSVVRKK